MRTNEIHSTVGREVEYRDKRFLVMLCSLLDPEWKGKTWKERTQLRLLRKMKDKNLSMEMVYVYHGRDCLRLYRACRTRVYQGESPVKFMELGSASAVLGEDCLCRQISVSMVVMLTDSICLCYQVSLNVGQIPHQDLEG